MKLSDDFDNEQMKAGISLGTMIVGVLFFVGIVIFAVIAANKEKFTTPPATETKEPVVSAETKEEDPMFGQSDLVSNDLDFWDMYKDDSYVEEDSEPLEHIDYTEKLKELEEKEEKLAKENDLSENGTKTEVILPDGTSQWVMINAFIEKNNYDYTGLVCEEPFMRYYTNAKKISKQGIKLDEGAGTVNFESLEEEGIDFCILRVGKRGYSTGSISYDANFIDYATKAKEAGLGVGVSFYSQAINPNEAIEEANHVALALQNGGIEVSYPIVFEMGYVVADDSRTKDLTKQQLTDIAKAFCDTIKNYGYTPVVYGDKYWLLRKLDLTQLVGYNINLSQDGDVPDYPYEFVLWDYNHEADMKGVKEKVTMCMSFVDYDMR